MNYSRQAKIRTKQNLFQNFSSKIRVGVLMGGLSPENEVSFNSGRTVCDHLDIYRYTIIPIYQTKQGELYILPLKFLHRGKTTDFEHRLPYEAQQILWDDLKECIDFMYIATHGNYAEDGILQGVLEVLNIPYLGAGVFASALRMDKITHKLFLKEHGIQVPDFTIVPEEALASEDSLKEYIHNALKNQIIRLPSIVKPHNQGSSVGVQFVDNQTDLLNAIQNAWHTDVHAKVIIEEYVEGMEFSCITLVDHVNQTYLPLPPTEIVKEAGTHIYDYTQKYMPGRATKYTPARCSETDIANIQKTCIRVMELLEFPTISRIDGFLKKDGMVVIFDPNSLSGMGPASFLFLQAAEAGMNHTQLINHLIETELSNYGITTRSETQGGLMDIATKSIEPKKRIAVLMGGTSAERETSLETGRNVVYKLSPEKYIPVPLFVSQDLQLYHLDTSLLVRNSTKEIATLIADQPSIKWSELSEIADFVFIGLHGGAGENGSVQGMLEMLHMPYNGSGVFASSLCMNKYKTNEFLAQQNIAIPTHLLIEKQEWTLNPEYAIEKIVHSFSFPLIVKPSDDGCSVMVAKVHKESELKTAITTLFDNGKTDALIEEYIEGTELTVGVLGNNYHIQVLPPTECITTSSILTMEEKFLPGAGENQTPALLEADAIACAQETVKKAFLAAQCTGYARIDCFYQNAQQSPTGIARTVIIEINTLPALTPATCLFAQTAEIGVNPMNFIDKIIELGFEKHKKLALHSSQLEIKSVPIFNQS